MAPNSYTIKVPSTSTEQHPKPHTVYNIVLSLPLQTFTLNKRYSEFLDLHSKVASQAGSPPPVSPPPKTYLPSFLGGRTSSNPALIETRRRGLEEYLQQLASETTDSRWRETSAWRTFLNLPSNMSSKSSTTSTGRINGSAPRDSVLASDPALWLDTHREVKSTLQEARKHISTGASSSNSSMENKPPSAIHEESAEAKKLLVKASGMISALDRGLKSSGDEWGRERLGDGELRRRRDLVAQAKQEKDDLDALLAMMGKKRDIEAIIEDSTLASSHGSTMTGHTSISGGKGSGVSRGRVLGKETAKTRELDNTGVLQLQAQMMREQDADVDVLTAAVRRQRELATQINEELAVQSDLLNLMEEDVDRVSGKIKVANKRVGKIK